MALAQGLKVELHAIDAGPPAIRCGRVLKRFRFFGEVVAESFSTK